MLICTQNFFREDKYIMEKNYQVVFTERNKVEVLDVPMPTPKDDQVMVRALVSQISTGTELTLLEANVSEDSSWNKNLKFPNYPGYSHVGEIVAVGKNLDPSLIGKKVLTGATHTKYAVSSEWYAIPEGVDADAAVFGIIAQITMASIRISQIRPGETVAVFGAGLIGQMLARLAKIAGALNVFVFDTSDNRLGMIPQDKCFIGVNSKDIDAAEFIKEHNGGELADIVFETTSYGPLAQKEIECITKNGKFIITSSPKNSSTIDFNYVSSQGITIIGAHNWAAHPRVATTHNRWTRQEDTKYFLRLLEKEVLTDINLLITHRASYKDAPSLYRMLIEDRTQALGVHMYWED